MEPSSWPGWLVLQALVLAELAAIVLIILAIHAGRAAIRHFTAPAKEHP